MPRGKKTCPDCGIENGVRTSICGCGHRFSSNASKEKVSTQPVSNTFISSVEKIDDFEDIRTVLSNRTAFSTISRPLIQTPAGSCSIKPKGFFKKDWPDGPATEEAIVEWSLKVFSSGNYSPEAVIYWMHEFWDMNLNFGAEYKRVKSIVIKTLYGNQA